MCNVWCLSCRLALRQRMPRTLPWCATVPCPALTTATRPRSLTYSGCPITWRWVFMINWSLGHCIAGAGNPYLLICFTHFTSLLPSFSCQAPAFQSLQVKKCAYCYKILDFRPRLQVVKVHHSPLVFRWFLSQPNIAQNIHYGAINLPGKIANFPHNLISYEAKCCLCISNDVEWGIKCTERDKSEIKWHKMCEIMYAS